MNGNGKAPVPFQVPAGTPLLGQLFTPLTVGVPMVMTGTCNCGEVADRQPLLIHPLMGLVRLLVERGILAEADVARVLTSAVTCPRCRKTCDAFFNPQTGKVQVNVIAAPAEDQGTPS